MMRKLSHSENLERPTRNQFYTIQGVAIRIFLLYKEIQFSLGLGSMM